MEFRYSNERIQHAVGKISLGDESPPDLLRAMRRADYIGYIDHPDVLYFHGSGITHRHLFETAIKYLPGSGALDSLLTEARIQMTELKLPPDTKKAVLVGILRSGDFRDLLGAEKVGNPVSNNIKEGIVLAARDVFCEKDFRKVGIVDPESRGRALLLNANLLTQFRKGNIGYEDWGALRRRRAGIIQEEVSSGKRLLTAFME